MTTTTIRKRYAAKHGSRESMQNTRDAIRALEPFKTSGALSAERGNFGLRWGNWLNEAETREFERVANHILYTVVSYGTPIGWAYRQDKDGFLPKEGKPASKVMWHVVDQKFSITTSAHQSVLRSALGGHRVMPKDPTIPHTDPNWMNQYQDESITYEGL